MPLRAFLCKFARVTSQSMSQKTGPISELIFYVFAFVEGFVSTSICVHPRSSAALQPFPKARLSRLQRGR
jgi:hypothetical protein